MAELTLRERRDRAFGKGAALFYEEPIHIVRGEGVYLFDAAGRRDVDMYNNVPCVGHGNPRVAEAMFRAQSTLNVHSRYLHEDIVEFAERLTGLMHDGIENVVFACTGTEANEIALRTARFVTGNGGVLCTNGTYHGNTELVGSLTHVGRANQASATVQAFPFPEKYRPIETNLDPDDLAEAYLVGVQKAIDALNESGAGVAAMILCSICANEGLPDIPAGFMAGAAQLVRDAGGVVIADEVQAGYARSGRWWGYESSEFEPDIVVTGKPMGNGLPLAATSGRRELIEAFRANTRYFNTFASSPLQAAVGMAVLDEIEERDLVANAGDVGGAMKSALAERQDRYAHIGDVRGPGLFIGVEMIEPGGDKQPDTAFAARVANRLKEHGFLTSNAGAYGNVLKLRPPLIFAQSDADEFVEAFDAVMDELDGT